MTSTYRPMTEEQRIRLTEAAFRRLEAARTLHAAAQLSRTAVDVLQKASTAFDEAVYQHSRVEEEIAREIRQGERDSAHDDGGDRRGQLGAA